MPPHGDVLGMGRMTSSTPQRPDVVPVSEADAAWLATAADVYVAAMDASADQASYRRRLFAEHTREPGWRAVSAGDPLVGFAYGFHCRPGQWWHDSVGDGLRSGLGEDAAAYWLSDAFCLAELHVLPAHQHHGLGRHLVAALLRGRTERTLVLSTPERSAPARAFYRSMGCKELMDGFTFPATRLPYVLIGRELH